MVKKLVFKLQIGQGLVEVLVALGISAIILSAIGMAVISSLRNTQYSQNQNLATQFASQGIEVVRHIRDSASSLSTFDKIYYCLSQNSTVLDDRPPSGVCDPNIDPRNIDPSVGNIYSFIRSVDIYPSANPLNLCPTPTPSTNSAYYAVVSVSWWDNACATSEFCHKVSLNSCFSDRQDIIPTP